VVGEALELGRLACWSTTRNDLGAVGMVGSMPTSGGWVIFVCFDEANHALHRAKLGDSQDF